MRAWDVPSGCQGLGYHPTPFFSTVLQALVHNIGSNINVNINSNTSINVVAAGGPPHFSTEICHDLSYSPGLCLSLTCDQREDSGERSLGGAEGMAVTGFESHASGEKSCGRLRC